MRANVIWQMRGNLSSKANEIGESVFPWTPDYEGTREIITKAATRGVLYCGYLKLGNSLIPET
jgi:hypothetical protein